MASPFTVTSVANYNANPPSDDGAQNTANQVKWSTLKTKLSDPIKAAFDASESNISAAIGKIPGGTGFVSTAVDYAASATDQGKTVKVTVAGKVVTTPDAVAVGSPFLFSILNASSGDITVDGNGSQTVDGDLIFTIPSGCGVTLNTDGSNWNSTDGRNFNNQFDRPQGYLSPTSGVKVITSDVIAATSIFYVNAYGGFRVPISTDGATFKMRQFSQLTLTLVSNHLAGTIYDVFLFDNSGVITIGTGPAWNSSAAGAGDRGTGAGTTEHARLSGIPVNANAITLRNGSTTYSVAVSQATYIGSIFIDNVAGQVTCHRSYGQNRKFGIWNAYNRVPIILKAGDPAASWAYNTNAIRPSNNSSANSITVFSGLSEEIFEVEFFQMTQALGNNSSMLASIQTGIGWNSQAAVSGFSPPVTISLGGLTSMNVNDIHVAKYIAPPSIGLNNAFCLETVINETNTSVNFFGGESQMILTAKWMG